MDNVPAARGYTGGFGTDLMLKDLGLATDAAKQAQATRAARRPRAAALPDAGARTAAGAQDFSSIINLLKTGS